jgi:hypothetical protein
MIIIDILKKKTLGYWVMSQLGFIISISFIFQL